MRELGSSDGGRPPNEYMILFLVLYINRLADNLLVIFEIALFFIGLGQGIEDVIVLGWIDWQYAI